MPVNRKTPTRGECKGWSKDVARRHTAWLRSIDHEQLTGVGYAITLTMRDAPKSAEVFHRMRRAFVKRLKRTGLIRMHWVVEWQLRKVPHLHGSVFFPFESDADENIFDTTGPLQNGRECMRLTQRRAVHLRAAWCEVCEAAGIEANMRGQDAKQLHDVGGWSKYVAKHCARSLRHAQRSQQAMPKGWTSTGRMWGSVLNWPQVEPLEFLADQRTMWRVRRFLRAGAIASARGRASWRELAFLRRQLKSNDRRASEVRPVSPWCSLETSYRLLRAADQLGSLHALSEPGDDAQPAGAPTASSGTRSR